MERDLNRRRFIELTGVASMAAIAGCSGDEGDGTTTEAPATTTEAAATTAEQEETTTEEEETTTEEEVDYTPPTETESALIEPGTLKEWQDAGLVNMEKEWKEDRVTIIRLAGDGYADGHIPGAVEWYGDLTETRLEGLAETPVMVPSGSTVDNAIQRAGVGEKTTIVVSGTNPMKNARLYWTLRYWGFPKEQVKVLNGGPTAYTDEYEESVEEPDIPDTNFNIKDAFTQPNFGTRKALNQMIQLADQKNAGESDPAFLDLRGNPDSAMITGTTVDPASNYVQAEDFQADAKWESADTLETHIFGLDGITDNHGTADGEAIITYCGSGYRAAMAFFALEGILGYDNVSLYDGSFSKQWSHYNEAQSPVPNDHWRTDINDRTNGEISATGLEIQEDLNQELTELADISANQIKDTDNQYMGGEASVGCGE